MDTKRARIILVTLACLTALSCFSSAQAKTSEKEAILFTCSQLFGAPVDKSLNLFEVNQAFALRVKFSKQGRLEEFAVEPKYFFNQTHPEWKEPHSFPYLSHSEYRDLVARLDSVRPKGGLREAKSGMAVVTNSTAHYKEIYERAALEWGELADGVGIRFFKVRYQKAKASK
jgi:hypothetical protein